MTLKDRVVDFVRMPGTALQDNAGNWREHPDRQRAALNGVLSEIGIAGALTAYYSERNGMTLTLIDGHLRKGEHAAAEWPVLVLDVTDEEADALLASIDPIAAMAQTNEAQLTALRTRLGEQSETLRQALDAAAATAGLKMQPAQGKDTPPPVDRAAELQAKWGTALGQVWQLGEHRLACGDCTDPAVVEAVMWGERAALVFTSPPYNKGTTTGHGFHGGGKTTHLKDGYGVYKDNRTHEEYAEWQSYLLKSWFEMLTDDGAIYYNHRPRTQNKILEHALIWNPGLPVRQIIIWHSNGGANLTPSAYVGVHEWIVIFAKPNFGLLSRSESGVGDVWTYGSGKVDGHPVPFPVELPEIALKTTGKLVVYEPFSGSGTTIIACENLKRKARAIEIDPGYVAVTLERWSQHTQQEPVLLG